MKQIIIMLFRSAEMLKKESLALRFLVGFETEAFTLLKNTNLVKAVNRHGCNTPGSCHPEQTRPKCLEEIAVALRIADVEHPNVSRWSSSGAVWSRDWPPSSFSGSRCPCTHLRNNLQYSLQTWSQSDTSSKSFLGSPVCLFFFSDYVSLSNSFFLQTAAGHTRIFQFMHHNRCLVPWVIQIWTR